MTKDMVEIESCKRKNIRADANVERAQDVRLRRRFGGGHEP
jgi:hypothetical protein